MKAVRRVALLSTLLAFLFGMAGALRAQTATGAITGTVTDATGAIIPQVKVTLRNQLTGLSREATTGDSGEYAFPLLPVGVYSVTAAKQGFQLAKRSEIQLNVADVIRVDLQLAVGAVTQTVDVRAGAVALDTETASVAQLVTDRQVSELPLNGRNFINLMFIGAGVVQTVGEMGQMRENEGNAISINGSRPESNNYTLDGLANTDTALGTPAVILSQDAIQEFKVQSDTYTAEYGFSANQVNIVSKSGTNQLHGSLFEFDRNDKFDAHSTFTPAQKPELRQNQFGFVLGGPVYLPRVYDGRNKTFWLVNYEGWRIRNGTSQFSSVPPTAELTGDFSAQDLPAFDTTPGSPCQLALALGNPCMPVDPNTGQPFPGNKIDSSRFSRLATVALEANVFAAPNCLTSDCLENYQLNTTLPNNTNQQTYKVDQNLRRLGSVFFRFTKASYSNESIDTDSPVYGLSIFTENSTSWEVAHTLSLGSSNVNNLRVGFLHATVITGSPPTPASDISALGLTGVFTNLPSYARGFPVISFQNYALFGNAGNPTTSDQPMWDYADSLTMVRGRHTIGVGVEFRDWLQKRDLSTELLGRYVFNNNEILVNGGNGANGCSTLYCGTGNAVADFLLGYYYQASTFQPGPFSAPGVAGNLNQYRYEYFAPYVQDNWKVTNNLTLNLGLRWDYHNVPWEETDKMFWIDVNNKNGGLCFGRKALLTDGIAPAGNGFYEYCGRHNPADGSKKPFAPRVGFAYRPFGGDKTVVRGGYGIYWDSSETREIDDSGDLYPFVVRTTLTPANQPPAIAPKLTDQLFPPFTTAAPVTISEQGGQFIAVIISERPRNPYFQQWSLSVQRELSRNTKLEVSYVGNRGLRLLDRTNINQPYPVSDPAVCQVDPTQGDCPLPGRTPYPNFTGNLTIDSRWDGYSSYNAANVKLERRTGSGAFLVLYTWAKALDDKSAAAGIGASNGFAGHMNDHQPQLDYGLSDFDVPNRFVASYVYNLPVGRGKRFLGNTNKGVDAVLGGWELTGITTFQQGFPFSVNANDTYNLLNAFCQRANIVGSPNTGFTKGPNEWFNTAAFAQPLAGSFGDSGRNILRDPGINNWDIGLAKNFALNERVHLQVRVEAFNTFNHLQWGVDPGSAAASGPGTSAIDCNVDDIAPNPDQNFGKIIYARPARIVQLGAKITF